MLLIVDRRGSWPNWMQAQDIRNIRPGSSADENAVIPYSIIFNGRQLVPGQRLNGLERAGIAGANLPLVLQLDGIPSGKLAGSYTDTIILTIEPEP